MRNHCLRTCYRCKIWAYLRKFFAPPGIPNYGYGSAGECCLMTTVSFATPLSLFPIKFLRLTSNFNRRNIMSKVLFYSYTCITTRKNFWEPKNLESIYWRADVKGLNRN